MRYRRKIKRIMANQVDRVAEIRILQAITQDGKEVKRIVSKIIRQAIEKLCKTPFHLLGNLDRKKYNQALGKIKIIAEKVRQWKRKQNI